MNIVVLGDCKSNGLNTMSWEVTNNPDVVVDISLKHEKQDKQVIKWFLSQRKKTGVATKLSTVDLRSASFKALLDYELEQSWPNHLKQTVYNYSKTGTTFQGYIAELKKHIQTYGKPDVVCITDYTDDHVYIRTNHQQEKHNAPVFRSLFEREYDNTIPYSKQIFEKRIKQGHVEYTSGQGYLNRKTKHSFYFLKRLCEYNNIKYFFVRFRNGTSSVVFDYKKTVDVTDINSIYTKVNGQHSLMSYKQQPMIAKKVQEYIDNAF